MKGTMKKTFLILLALVLVFTLALSACGKKDEEKKDETTKAEETTAAPETTEASGGEDMSEYVGIVTNLIERYNQLLYINGAGLQADDSVTYTDGIHQYRKVTDPQFQNFGDMHNYLDDTFTIAAASYYFPSIYDPTIDDVPIYVYINDGSAPEGLYEMMAGKGIYPYELQEVTDVTLESDTILRATASALSFGQEGTINMSCVLEGDTWKITDWNYVQ